jgi:hypothetical protein
MKWCRVSVEGRAVYGILEGSEVVPVEGDVVEIEDGKIGVLRNR